MAPGFFFSLVVVAALALAACSSSQTPSATPTTAAPSASNGSSRSSATSTTGGATFGQGEAGVIAACQSDWNSVEVALQAYDAETGSYPTPPSPWSTATYATNYTPLTRAGHGGPFMPSAPLTTHYVIEYDAAGHIWVAPPGKYDAAYSPARDATSDACYLDLL
jgi:hypothetical protein